MDMTILSVIFSMPRMASSQVRSAEIPPVLDQADSEVQVPEWVSEDPEHGA